MIANYHTHTWRCNHATGTEREYVESGIKAGLKILGFSDHSPYIFPGSYYSNFRMKLSMLDGYVQTVLTLRKAYAGQIEIPLGLELEYYPELFPNLLPVLRDYPLDYLLLGQHFVGNEFDAPYSGQTTYDNSEVTQYVNQSIDAMQTGLFTYFAHPDLLNYCGDRHFYRTQMRRLCREAKSCGLPLEYNLLGLAGGRNYPNSDFWELAAEEGCQVILGRDAHSPKALLDARTETEALRIIQNLGMQLIDTVPLRPIR